MPAPLTPPSSVNPQAMAQQDYQAASSAVGVPKMAAPGTYQAGPNPYLAHIAGMVQAALASSQGILANEAKFGKESGAGGIVAGYSPEQLTAAQNAPLTAMRTLGDIGTASQRNDIMGQQMENEAAFQQNENATRLAQAQYGAYGNFIRGGDSLAGAQLRAAATTGAANIGALSRENAAALGARSRILAPTLGAQFRAYQLGENKHVLDQIAHAGATALGAIPKINFGGVGLPGATPKVM